jgi:hypothetical protein
VALSGVGLPQLSASGPLSSGTQGRNTCSWTPGWIVAVPSVNAPRVTWIVAGSGPGFATITA